MLPRPALARCQHGWAVLLHVGTLLITSREPQHPREPSAVRILNTHAFLSAPCVISEYDSVARISEMALPATPIAGSRQSRASRVKQ